ncbi:hypothetical protein J3B02_003651, partial [Coemansia erecta]
MSTETVAQEKQWPEFSIRPAVEADVDQVLWFIKELASFENTPDPVTTTSEQLRQILFGSHRHPDSHALLVYAREADGQEKPVAFALYYYDLFLRGGQLKLYLVNMFVCSEYRRMGIGKLLLSRLANIASENGCARMEWRVQDWNQPAIEFYESIGARQLKGITI